MSKIIKLLGIVIAMPILLSAASVANAGVVLTYAEAPGQENSTLTNTNVLTFDNLTADTQYQNLAWTDSNNNVVGTFDKIYIKGVDQYGGAGPNGSNYQVQSGVVGYPNNVEHTTLTLNTPSAYFGMWWSAGDPYNELQFYDRNNTLVAQFTTATLLSYLPTSYNGNPRSPTTLDANERFAFINFYAVAGDSFSKIVLSDTQVSGFEADNFTVRTQAWGTLPGDVGPLPGVKVETVTGTSVVLAPNPVPEPSIAMLMLTGFAAITGMRKFKKSA